MKKIIVCLIFVLAMCGLASAQTPREVIDKVKQIKLLEDSRNDVKRVLVDYELSGIGEDASFDYFFTDAARIEVSYSNGECEADEDDEESKGDVGDIWNVGDETTTKIIIIFHEQIKIEESGFDLSKFKKEKKYPNSESHNDLIFHDKNSGIALITDEDGIGEIVFYPAKNSYAKLCDNKAAKKFAASENWFGGDNVKASFDRNLEPSVDELNLSATEIRADCRGQHKNRDRSEKAYKISVKTVASDPENDPIVYNYTVSGGKIVGKGANVVWDLTGVKPGTYTVTVGVDDGCGVCSSPKTETVIVREYPNCGGK